MTAAVLPVVNVAVAVVQRSDGRVLLAERPQGKESGGFWEFPGGKFDAGERVEQALAREVREEVGIEINTTYPWMTYEHDYPDKRVCLHFHRVLDWHGTPHGREGQRVSWEDPAAVNVGPLLPANGRALAALNLPSLYAITNSTKYGQPGFLTRLERALANGLQLVQVRERSMTSEQFVQFARRVVALAHRYDARVLVNGDAGLARRSGADGVHVPADALRRLHAPPAGFWAASCHDARDLARAAQLQAGFVVLSPVLPTASHPGEPGLGWPAFERLVQGYPLPVYALGGMRLEYLEVAMRHGAHGVSLQSEVW